jgi:putative ABC transport system substrate-binding protein
MPRVGVLSGSGPSPEVQRLLSGFRQGLRELGYVEGNSIAIEYRFAEWNYERLPKLAAELLDLKVDVIVAVNAPAVEAARQKTRETPIVVTLLFDPVAAGLVASLARPGGNITGLSLIAPESVHGLREDVASCAFAASVAILGR